MVDALWITLIGMGLVFVAILLLWGLMALLVRLTVRESGSPEPQPVESQQAEALLPTDRRKRAAAAAVAAALALEQQRAALPRFQESTPDARGSWQSAQRAAGLRRDAGRRVLPGKNR